MYKFLILSALLINISHCGDFFTIGDNVYFMSYPLMKNWYGAGRYCTFHGMHLFDVNTEAEKNIAMTVLQGSQIKFNFSTGFVWTSGTDLGSEGQYYWETTGNPLLYTNWKTNQPNNAHTFEHCIEIQWPANVWNDRPCLTESSFICQKYKSNVSANCQL